MDGTVDNWKQVMWFDESRFQLHHADVRVRIQRERHENIDIRFIATKRQVWGETIMI